MVRKTIVKWAGVGAVLVLAACSDPTGALTECVMGDENIMSCSTPTAEPAEAGIETIAY